MLPKGILHVYENNRSKEPPVTSSFTRKTACNFSHFFSSKESKAYPLIVGNRVISVYCHMIVKTENGICGVGGWTLVMKIDGEKVLFID